MSWKKTIILALVSSVLAAVSGIIYNSVYSKAFYVDFSSVLGTVNIISSCTIGCFLMAIGYKIVLGWKGNKLLGWLNIVYAVLSFASIIGVLGFTLPLEIESPEMFPGLAIPMHFFPALALFTVFPFFQSQNPQQK